MTPTAPARCLLAFALLALLTGCKTAEKKNEPIVRKLHIEGAEQVKEGAIKKKILTAETGWIPIISKPQYFDPDIWRTDLRRIERYYRERGYYQAEVVEDHVERQDDNHVQLSVRVAEGKPTVISEVKVNGLDALPPEHRERLQDHVKLKPGQVFIEDDWENLKGAIQAELRELGYVEAKVEGKAYVDVATQQAKIDIRVDPGQRYHFGELKLLTGEHPEVEGWRILEQARAKVKSGDWYSESALSDAQARVFKMGVFGAAKVRPDVPNPSTGTNDIIVDVREAPFHSVRLGVGIHLDQSRNDGRLTADYTDRDFLGALRRLNLHAEAGWAFIPNAYATATNAVGAKNGPIARLSADLQQPRIGVRDLGLETRLEVERGLEPAYAYYGGRGRLGVNYRPTPYLALTLAYNLELYRLEEGEALLGGTAPTLLFGCPSRCILSYLEQRVEWDHRDDKQEPKRGYYLAFGVQEGGGILGGSFTYLRLLPEGRAYESFVDDKLTVAARLRLGTLIPASGNDLDSPIVTRFYSGGADSMRGFSARRLSPQAVSTLPEPRDDFTGYTVPVGGNGLLEGSVEARYNVWGALVVATFLDTGFVTTESLQPSVSYFTQNLFYAVGAGLRYRTPAGPIRLDFAYRLPIGPPLPVYQPVGVPPLTYASEGTCFGIGNKPNPTGAGAPEGPCSIHLSIGEAF